MSAFGESLRVYRNPRLLAILAMGFASGLPLALTGATLQVWLTEAQVSLTNIGLFALVGVAYSAKFVWSPVLDRVPLPWISRLLGQRRAWLLAIELLLAGAILALGATDPAHDPWRTALLAALVAFLSASQDIVIDAYRIELLRADEQGAGAAATQWGYKFGQLASGAGALYLASAFGWPATYLVMASLIGVGVIAVVLTPEPVRPAQPTTTSALGFLRTAIVDPFAEFASRPGWVQILVFILLFKLGDALAGMMASAFYLKIGFSKIEIANVAKLFGLIATMGGIAAGGMLVFRLGILRSLVIGGALQMLSNLTYVAQSYAGHDVRMLVLTIFVENFTSGLGAAAFVAYMSALCNASFTATQYALLTSIASIGRTVLSSSGGWLAETLGWPLFFGLTTLAALPGLALAVRMAGYGATAALQTGSTPGRSAPGAEARTKPA